MLAGKTTRKAAKIFQRIRAAGRIRTERLGQGLASVIRLKHRQGVVLGSDHISCPAQNTPALGATGGRPGFLGLFCTGQSLFDNGRCRRM